VLVATIVANGVSCNSRRRLVLITTGYYRLLNMDLDENGENADEDWPALDAGRGGPQGTGGDRATGGPSILVGIDVKSDRRRDMYEVEVQQVLSRASYR